MLMIGSCGSLESVNLTILPAFAKDLRSLVASRLISPDNQWSNAIFALCRSDDCVVTLFGCPIVTLILVKNGLWGIAPPSSSSTVFAGSFARGSRLVQS